jgi:hypothetical protein
MAASSDCREEVTKNGGIRVLLQFLEAKHNKSNSNTSSSSLAAAEEKKRPEDFAQMAATERVLQKSAIALSRCVSRFSKLSDTNVEDMTF